MKVQTALEDAMRLKLKFQGITSSDVYTSLDTVARVVREEKPDLRPHAAPDGTVTILFSDIEGSTQMADRLGDKQFMEVIRDHNAIFRSKIVKYGGFEVKNEGDGFMVAFQSARKALDCAVGIQFALAERNESAEEPVRVRMGLHAGETIKEETPAGKEDFFGRNVILAARIAAQARGGQILISSLLKALVDSAGDLTFDKGRDVELKGLSGTHRVHAVVWSADAQPSEGPAPVPSALAPGSPGVLYCTTSDDVRIAYATFGEGPPVVFIPYFNESFSIPEEQQFYERIGKARTVVRYDSRGTGLSECDVKDFSHEALIRDLEAVVKALGLRQFTLWGQTLAGPRAIDFVTRTRSSTSGSSSLPPSPAAPTSSAATKSTDSPALPAATGSPQHSCSPTPSATSAPPPTSAGALSSVSPPAARPWPASSKTSTPWTSPPFCRRSRRPR